MSKHRKIEAYGHAIVLVAIVVTFILMALKPLPLQGQTTTGKDALLVAPATQPADSTQKVADIFDSTFVKQLLDLPPQARKSIEDARQLCIILSYPNL